MFKAIRGRWALKILIAFLLIIVLTGIINTAVMNLSIQAAFDRHLGRMGEGMQTMMGNMRGLNIFANFRAAVNESLLISFAVAFFIAIAASLLISRLITRPVNTLTNASQSIAKGEYTHRIPKEEVSADELGQLAVSFNQMAEKLEQTETMRRQLIGDISHELRTPLTAIKGSMEGLIDGILPKDETTFAQIYFEADRLQRLVEDLQELSHIEGGQFKLNEKSIEIEDLAKSAVSALESAFAKKNVSLNLRSEKNLPKIKADPDRILQVLQNLLGNALQFTPSGGEAVVALSKSDNGVEVSVQDNGAGVEAKHIDHIFERFYRADPSRSRTNGGGSGIGLTISKTIIEAHAGIIWAESRGKNQGSKFTFTLPE
ncbi:MAG: ATP-binding protein [Pelolinea sp.]|nr:ATP-binding protein [Pelolinea sp.]